MNSEFIVIAHRGASGYLPEHTLPAKALAYGMGADFLEQDIVATRDNALVVLHDIHVDRVSNVTEAFPERARSDGRYYVRDFDLEELQSLRVWERTNADGTPVYPGRYPSRSGNFRIHTLADELELVKGLNLSSGATAGIYPEIKRPAWHQAEGIDIAPMMLECLAFYGYETPADSAYLQCFDHFELRRIRQELGSELRLVQLLGANYWGEADTDYDQLRTPSGLEKLAKTVDAVGPWVNLLYTIRENRPISSGLAERAHDLGLQVHPYTLRADDLPPGFSTFDELLGFLTDTLAVDGVFTDFPDRVRSE